MTTFNSPSHALGLMAIEYYNAIAHVLPHCMLSSDGAKEIYPLVLGLDAMLYSYRDTMHFTGLVNGKPVQVGYWEKIKDLNKRKKDLKFIANYGEEWVEWFHEYLVLLSSCFNRIGLAPLKEMNSDDDEFFFPSDEQQNNQSDDEAVSSQGMESDLP